MKKRIFKKSGFTLVEIVVAFAVFAVMAAMIVQILNLAINRRQRNMDYSKSLQQQEQTLIAKGKDLNFDSAHGTDGTLDLKFNGLTDTMHINYQLKNANGEAGGTDGVNYIVGELDYNGPEGGIETTTSGGTNSGGNGGIGTGAVTNRFDTRITGTKGISGLSIDVENDASDPSKYKLKVNIDGSGGVDPDDVPHSQVSIFFGAPQANAELAKVVEISNVVVPTGARVQKCGENGVNIHSSSTGFSSSTTMEFVVKLDRSIPGFSAQSFGNNVTGTGHYSPYEYLDASTNTTYIYVNIFGAYPKNTTTSTPTSTP